jgi:predicted regulator of Ras-like GTPase activity (Roadblock/LC7/MglB family)
VAGPDAAQALEELVEISSQIEGAVLTAQDGKLVASTYGDTARGERVAAAASELLRAADESQARAERAPITQLVAELPEGAVVCVRENGRTVAATTVKEPTVGLVLYDLRTTLRLAGEAEPERAVKPRKSPARKPAAKTDEPEQKDEAGAGA